MDKLISYIQDRGASNFAKDLGCSKQLVSHWVTGRQKPSAKMAKHIEDVTKVVKRADILPEIFGCLHGSPLH